MASPSDPEPLPQSQIDARRGHIEEREQSEAFGMVTVARYVKDDGRALILYTHRQDGEPSEGRSA